MPNCMSRDDYIYHRNRYYTNVKGETKIYLVCKYRDILDCSGKGELDHENNFTRTEPHDKNCKEAFAAETAEFRAEIYHAVKTTPCGLENIYTSVAKKYTCILVVESTRITVIAALMSYRFLVLKLCCILFQHIHFTAYIMGNLSLAYVKHCYPNKMLTSLLYYLSNYPNNIQYSGS